MSAGWALVGCGGEKESASGGSAKVGITDEGQKGGVPCSYLSAEQVSSVLPGHDGGAVAHSGGSLLKGVDSYQCSYTAVSGAEARLLTVVITTASTAELFDKIKPSGFADQKEEAIAVGDGGWSRGEADDWKVTVIKGRSLIDLELMAPGARALAPKLVALAEAIAGKL